PTYSARVCGATWRIMDAPSHVVRILRETSRIMRQCWRKLQNVSAQSKQSLQGDDPLHIASVYGTEG
ncbi:MAG: hypothetical protein ACK53L_04980, partial [Pirellulaceae bacterium]